MAIKPASPEAAEYFVLFSARLNYLRKSLKMPVKTLARLAGMSRTQLIYIFAGRHANISLQTIVQLAKGFGVEPRDLFPLTAAGEKELEKMRKELANHGKYATVTAQQEKGGSDE